MLHFIFFLCSINFLLFLNTHNHLVWPDLHALIPVYYMNYRHLNVYQALNNHLHWDHKARTAVPNSSCIHIHLECNVGRKLDCLDSLLFDVNQTA